jgi:hypothetical protein
MATRLDPIEQAGDRHEATRIVEDTISSEAVDGMIMVMPPNIEDDTAAQLLGAPVADSAVQVTEEEAINGGVVMKDKSLRDTIKRIFVDTLAAVNIVAKNKADDTNGHEEGMTMRNELTVYPNPVRKGASVHLSWKMEVGAYRVNLLSLNGGVIQSWMVKDGSTVQTMTMPGRIAAGAYILQVTAKGNVFAEKLIIE